jgi:hypothetical protein
MKQTDKQPIYKNWWVWIIVVLIVIGGIIGISQSTKKNGNNSSSNSSSSKVIKPKPVTDKNQAKKIAQNAIFEYLTKEKKQKIKKSDVEITSIKTTGPYNVKNSKKTRMNGWEIQGKINEKSKGASVDLVSAVVNMPDQNKNHLDYLSIGWDTFINEVKQDSSK